MTRELAIKILSTRDVHGVPCGYTAGYTEALDMAIKALKQEPCDDCISRQALQEWIKDKTFGDIVVASEHNFDCLPPVTPQPKTGHWKSTIDGKPICSECGFVSESEDGYFVSHYCPNCGAKMVDSPESEEISEHNMKMWEEIFKAESEDKE